MREPLIGQSVASPTAAKQAIPDLDTRAFQDVGMQEQENDEVRQELRKDEHGNFFILAHDAAGQPFYRPFRLMSNTAVTSIEMTTQ